MQFANGIALRSPSRYSYYYPGAKINPQYRRSCSSSTSSSISSARVTWSSRKSLSYRKLRAKPRKFGNFEEKSNLGYYDRTVVRADRNREPMHDIEEETGSWNGMSTKNKLKLLKGLAKCLYTFSELGYGIDIDEQGLSNKKHEARTIAKITQLLISMLKRPRAQQDDLLLDTKKKEEKAMLDCDSSSSSESSDSESDCDEEEVVDMSNLRSQAAATATVENNSSISSVDAATSSESLVRGRRVEVCMGGKCEKSGGPALMEEFQNVLGFGGAVVACKCLGNCKYGPNVRVVNCSDTAETTSTDDSFRVPSNPLCLGVAMDDVDWIVASYF